MTRKQFFKECYRLYDQLSDWYYAGKNTISAKQQMELVEELTQASRRLLSRDTLKPNIDDCNALAEVKRKIILMKLES